MFHRFEHRLPCLFSPACRAGEPPFFAWPKKGGPKKGHPGAAFFVPPWTKNPCEPAGLADAPSLARRQVGAILCAHPAGLIVRPAPQHRVPGKSSASTAAIVASLEARSNCLLRRHVRAGCAPNGALGCGARSAETPAGWRTGSAPVRRRHRDVPSAHPGERARTRSTWMCGGRIRGVAFSLVTFSCHARESYPRARRRTEKDRDVKPQ